MKARTASVPTSPSRTLQTTEPVATTKKAGVKNPLPCTTPGCLNFSIQGVDGLCEECLRKKGNSPLLAESAPQSNNSQGFNSGFVSRPVEQNRHFDSIAAGPLHLPVQVCQAQSHLYRSEEAVRFGGNVHGMKCRQENCTLFGTPETNGYCSRCFLDSTIPQSGPFSIPGDVMTIIIVVFIYLFILNFSLQHQIRLSRVSPLYQINELPTLMKTRELQCKIYNGHVLNLVVLDEFYLE